MKAFLRNLLIGGIFALVAAQARAQPAVTWTFQGMPFTELQDAVGTAIPTAPGEVFGGLQSGGTMTFNASGALIDYRFETSGGPFSNTYTFSNGSAYLPGDPANPLGGNWTFETFSPGGAQYLLSFNFSSDPSTWGPGPILPISITQGASGEAYADASNPSYDGTVRVPGHGAGADPEGLAVRVPEPASVALLGAGLLGLGLVRRRRNRKLG